MVAKYVLAAVTIFPLFLPVASSAQNAGSNLSKDELAAKENAELVNDTVACVKVRYDRSEAAIRKLDDPILNPSLPFRILDAGVGVAGVHLNCPNNICASGTLAPDETRNHCASLGVTGEVKFSVLVQNGEGDECIINPVGDGDVVQVTVDGASDSNQRPSLNCSLNPPSLNNKSDG